MTVDLPPPSAADIERDATTKALDALKRAVRTHPDHERLLGYALEELGREEKIVEKQNAANATDISSRVYRRAKDVLKR